MDDHAFGSIVANMSLTVALMNTLKAKGVISAQESKEIVDTALLHIEQAYGGHPEAKGGLDIARALLEGQLKGKGKG